jgi:O-antigen biosynthesis protein WbqP
MKRSFDVIFSLIFSLIFFIPILIVAILIKATSPGPVIFWSDRVGQNNKIFKMPKFRTMRVETPNVATHLLQNPNLYQTKIGPILRKLSLDEIPQLLSIFKGDMSLVGPRPALYNQADLIELRTKVDVHKLFPGVTGWAQINGRDEISIPEKVGYDEYYLHNQSGLFDIKIVLLTILKVFKMQGISH